jgi:hypothetical protein
VFASFLQAWFKKMDLIFSRESLRINLIAIYTMLPYFPKVSVDLLHKHFGDIGRLTFGQLDSYMFLKLTNNSCRFHSPSKIDYDKCTFPYGGAGALQ